MGDPPHRAGDVDGPVLKVFGGNLRLGRTLIGEAIRQILARRNPGQRPTSDLAA